MFRSLLQLLLLVVFGYGLWVGALIWGDYRDTLHQQAAHHADCIAHPPVDDMDRFVCGPAPKQ